MNLSITTIFRARRAAIQLHAMQAVPSMPYKYDTYIDASNGANLVTTPSTSRCREHAEKELEKTYYDSKPLNRCYRGRMNPKTGAILAMGTYPSFDLNEP